MRKKKVEEKREVAQHCAPSCRRKKGERTKFSALSFLSASVPTFNFFAQRSCRNPEEIREAEDILVLVTEKG